MSEMINDCQVSLFLESLVTSAYSTKSFVLMPGWWGEPDGSSYGNQYFTIRIGVFYRYLGVLEPQILFSLRVYFISRHK